MNRPTSAQLFESALSIIPGGVNSPVRAFKSVGGNPVFMAKAKGAYLYDVDGNAYIDLINSWGPMILGHAREEVIEAVQKVLQNSFSFGAPGPLEVEMAQLITEMVPSIEMVRMVNSGTEATMAAIRLARAYTKRSILLKFEGCYHGHADSFLIAAGSGAATLGVPDSPGVTAAVARDTVTVPFNNVEALQAMFAKYPDQIAAVIVEPVVGNMGCVLPEQGFLESLREICTKEKSLLIFDEVMTGFRLSAGGAQVIFNIQPDLTTLGKIIGGGLPVGAYGGRKEIMEMIAPSGPVYQAGTLSGNPVAMAAGIAQLNLLKAHPEWYTALSERTSQMAARMLEACRTAGVPASINQIGSMFTLFFTEKKVLRFEDAKASDLPRFGVYFQNMLNRGVYLAPSQFESLFVSTAIGEEEEEHILKAHRESLTQL
jgi:glutamate-1-semialdehyde 2,1-aminomutase